MEVKRNTQHGTGYAAATGMLIAYLVEVIRDLPEDRQQHWQDLLTSRAREGEREIIIDRLSQEETYE